MVVNLLVIYGVLNSEQAEGWMQLAVALIAVVPATVYVIGRVAIKRVSGFANPETSEQS